MTDFELTQLVYIANEAGNTALALYMTAVSGYLIIAYSVGAAMNRYQLALVNALFLFFSGAFSYSAMISFHNMRTFSEALFEKIPGQPSVSSTAEDTFLFAIVGSLILGIVGSIVFMWDVRRRSGDV